jgi:CubicO group peptidase (beta-lactamase class C family)
MISFTRLVPLLPVLCNSVANAVNPCPLLGPSWPAPTSISADPIVSEALQNVTTTIQQAISAGNFSGNSLSLQIFDANDPGALLSLSYTANDINTTLGVSKVDENTVFRIGSTSKLFTMIMLLIENGFSPLQDPISDFIPELRRAAIELSRNSTQWDDGIDFTKWNEVTVGELASHLAGIARDCMCSCIGPCLASLATLTDGIPRWHP